MSDGIQKAAGEQLRQRLRSLAKNKTRGILTGLITTSLVQSSSATTVMVVSFVNAGLITLAQSVPVIFGANIGTTITAWIVSIGGFVFNIQDIALPILVVALPMFFRAKGRTSYWGEFLIGFSILFIGLGFLQSSIPTLSTDSDFVIGLQRFTEMGLLSSFLFMFFGVLVTYILQSSSAAMTLTLTMVFNGWIPIELAAAMVLGENIGTTITAELAALVANIYAKRSARVHTLFNVIGAFWMVFFIPIVMRLIEWFFIQFTGNSQPFDLPLNLTVVLASFHTLFNVLNHKRPK